MDDIVPRTDALQIAGEKNETYEIIAGRADAGLIIVCDHASNALPESYGRLGLAPEQFERHIAYDIGGEGVTRLLSAELGVPAILTRYSRLLIDPNRGEDDPTLIMRISDGAVIPGNRSVSDQERQMRLERYYRPYHTAIDALIDSCIATEVVPTLLSIHSFTDVWRGARRPWHVGVLWGQDQRLPQPLLAALGDDADLVVGDNEPYLGEMEGDCMWQHGTCRGLPHAIIELRQDLIATNEGQAIWAKRLADVMRQVQTAPGLHMSL